MDDSVIKLSTASGEVTIPRGEVALVVFQPATAELAEALAGARKGVLMTSGDFIDGDVETVRDGAGAASSGMHDTSPRLPRSLGTALHSQTARRYACGHGMAGASPPLCFSSLHSVEYFCASIPLILFADSLTTKSVSIRRI